MNKEEDLTFGGRNLVDEVNHVYRCFDVYYLCYVFDVCYFVYVVGYSWSISLSVMI